MSNIFVWYVFQDGAITHEVPAAHISEAESWARQYAPNHEYVSRWPDGDALTDWENL